jgi:quercetin dioxygenase-like cupin family protein
VKHVHYSEVEALSVDAAGAEDASVRWLISDEDGAANFYMRRFDLAPGGRTPHHRHPWEHEIYVLEGAGTAHHGATEEAFRPGDVFFIPGGAEHCFVADAGAPVAFLCLVPTEGGVDRPGTPLAPGDAPHSDGGERG